MTAWGIVTQTSPLRVRVAGGTGDISVMKNSAASLAVNDKVLLVKAGVQWIAVCVVA